MLCFAVLCSVHFVCLYCICLCVSSSNILLCFALLFSFLPSGIGDMHEVMEKGGKEGKEGKETLPQSESTPISFDRQYIRMAMGTQFEGDVCTDLEEPPAPPSSLGEEEREQREDGAGAVAEAELVKHRGEGGAPLTASEVQALGDMALQSAVRGGHGGAALCCHILCRVTAVLCCHML